MDALFLSLLALSFLCRICLALVVYAAVKALPALLYDFVPDVAAKLFVLRLPARAWVAFALLCALSLVI